MKYYEVYWESEKSKSKYLLIIDYANNRYKWSDSPANDWSTMLGSNYFDEGIEQGRFRLVPEEDAFLEML